MKYSDVVFEYIGAYNFGMHVDSYNFGEITIDGMVYTSDIIIFPGKVMDNWRRMEGHKLSLDDIPEVIRAMPEVLVIGTGESGVMKVPSDVISAIEAKGIKVIVKRTADACDEYNKISGSARIIAALHLTC